MLKAKVALIRSRSKITFPTCVADIDYCHGSVDENYPYSAKV